MSTDKMDYARNYHYFFPTPRKKPISKEPTEIRGGIIIIIIGFCLAYSLPEPILGLVVAVIGIAWIAKIKYSDAEDAKKIKESNQTIIEYNKNNCIVVQDSEIDMVVKNYIDNNLKSMALNKLAISEEECKEIEPIQIGDYYLLDNLKNFKPEIRIGSDKRCRSSLYNAIIFLFSANQIFCYQVIFSLLKDEKQETAKEFFYRDIVEICTKSEIISLDGEKIEVEEFTLTTIGGTEMKDSISDKAMIRSVQNMKKLLRSKKQ